MPRFSDIAQAAGERYAALDVEYSRIRQSFLFRDVLDHLDRLRRKNNSNVVVYASEFTTPAPGRSPSISINQNDIRGFMQAMSYLEKGDKECPLDLVLHTPGGSPDDTEAIVKYLRQEMFPECQMRVYVPGRAMSAGTMMCCAADEIYMGKHSALGPTDLQINGIPIADIIEEYEDITPKLSPDALNKRFPRGYINLLKNAEKRGKSLTEEFLKRYHFAGDKKLANKATEISKWLADRKNHLSHGRPLHFSDIKKVGMKVKRLEDDSDLQDIVLSVYHSLELVFEQSPIVKIVSGHVPSSVFVTYEKRSSST